MDLRPIPASAVLVLLALLPLPARAEEPPPPDPAAALPAAREEARDLAAKALRRNADAAWSAGLEATGAELYGWLLRFDPEDERARERLGHGLKDGKWQPPPGPRREFVDDGKSSRAASLEKRRVREFAPVGAAFARVGSLCRDAGLEKEAEAAWKEVLLFDPEHTGAREALGHTRVEGAWLTWNQSGHRDWSIALARRVAELREEPLEIRPVEGRSRFEEALELTLAKARGERYRVEAAVKASEAKELVAVAERTERFLEGLLGASPELLNRYTDRFVIVTTKVSYHRGIDALVHNDDATRAWAKKLGGWYLGDGTLFGWQYGFEGMKDLVAHKTAEGVLWSRFGTAARKPWVHEAFGQFASGMLLGSTATWCVTRETSSVGRARFDEFGGWGGTLKALVKDHEDRDLAVIVKLDLNSLGKADVAKAWSFFYWLFEDKRTRVVPFLRLLDGGMEEEEAAVEALGAGLESLDRQWREWVLEVY